MKLGGRLQPVRAALGFVGITWALLHLDRLLLRSVKLFKLLLSGIGRDLRKCWGLRILLLSLLCAAPGI